MQKRRLFLVIPACLAVLAASVFGLGSAFSAQTAPCRSGVPAVGPQINTQALPLVRNFDPCTQRFTMTDDALKHQGGPYIDKSEAERRAIGPDIKPTKVRSYRVSYAQAQKLIGDSSTSTWVYPDREVWLVVVQAHDQGPMPSLMAGVKPWPREWYYEIIDATTGRSLQSGGNGPNGGTWPVTLLAD